NHTRDLVVRLLHAPEAAARESGLGGCRRLGNLRVLSVGRAGPCPRQQQRNSEVWVSPLSSLRGPRSAALVVGSAGAGRRRRTPPPLAAGPRIRGCGVLRRRSSANACNSQWRIATSRLIEERPAKGSLLSSLWSSENSRATRFSRDTIAALEVRDSMPFTTTIYSCGRAKRERKYSLCACWLKKRCIGPSGSQEKLCDTRSFIRLLGCNWMNPSRSRRARSWMHSALERS